MKILLALMLFTFQLQMFAAFLENVPHKITQPNGKIYNVFLTGDEFHQRMHDGNNFTIIRANSGWYEYAILSQSKLQGSGCRVGECNPKLSGISSGIDVPDNVIEAKRNDFVLKMKKQNQQHQVKNLQSTGSINNLVVFIRFADEVDFTGSINVYDSMFNSVATNANSLKNYFLEASYNNINISSTLYPITSGNVLSYQDGYNRNYYEPYNDTFNVDGYVDADDRTNREHTLLKNAIDYISAQVPTDLNLDFNNDGYVDNVCFIIKGEPGEWAELLWPHRWALYTQTATINGLQVYDFNFQIESFFFEPTRGVAVLCHEMFHTLGAPDLYHYNMTYRYFKSVGMWDPMDKSRNPAPHMCSYMKFRYGMWINEIPEITEFGYYNLNSLQSSVNNCYKIASPNNPYEYFVLEYRKLNGVFEGNLPNEGLLIYRINTSSEGAGNSQYPDYPDEIYLYRPDGLDTINGQIENAPFNPALGNTLFNDVSNPSCFLSDGSEGGIKISEVSLHGDSLTFLYGVIDNVAETANAKIFIYPNPADKYLSIIGISDKRNVKVSIINSLGVVVFSGLIDSRYIDISALNPGMYLISVEHSNGKFVSRFVRR